jgi:hypothetical protein
MLRDVSFLTRGENNRTTAQGIACTVLDSGVRADRDHGEGQRGSVSVSAGGAIARVAALVR